MVCPTCSLDNDPTSTVCARCNTALTPQATYPPFAPHPSSEAPTMAYPPATPVHPPPTSLERRYNLPLLIGAAVLILITAIGAVVYSRSSVDPADPPADVQAAPVPAATTTATAEPTTPPAADPTGDPTITSSPPAATGDPREQARALDAVLSASVRSRTKLNRAIQKVQNCDNLNGAVKDLRAVGTERQSQMETVRNADLSALPGGEELRSQLVSALQYAWEADQGFLAWAEPTLTGGCGAADGSGYTRGRAESDNAGVAKRAFLADWNPVARANGLAARSADNI